ncbi:MAG: hypothetical protein IT449_19035 [Phycisphaerales bacterium]|nr:hypothetical protein [Phycisphaerales bacterium]
MEAAAIDLLGLESLSNRVRGHGIRQGGRASVDSVAAILSEKQAKIREPAMLINIRRAFRHDMSLQEIYDATRAAWKVGWKRDRARYALSVFGGIVREVFEIAHWLPAGSTMRAHDKDGRPRLPRDRWEFVGRAADELLRKRYVNHSVRHSLPQGAQNPIMYVNCD